MWSVGGIRSSLERSDHLWIKPAFNYLSAQLQTSGWMRRNVPELKRVVRLFWWEAENQWPVCQQWRPLAWKLIVIKWPPPPSAPLITIISMKKWPTRENEDKSRATVWEHALKISNQIFSLNDIGQPQKEMQRQSPKNKQQRTLYGRLLRRTMSVSIIWNLSQVYMSTRQCASSQRVWETKAMLRNK